MNHLKAYIKDLTSLSGVSSKEEAIIAYMAPIFTHYGDEVEVDSLGNLICSFKSNARNPKTAMIFAHMDEIGFIVRKIESNGFLRVERIGGVHINVLPGLRVDVIGRHGTLPGLIGTTSHHFTKAQDKGKVPSAEDLYIDIGAISKEQAEGLGVTVGTTITYHSDFVEMPNHLISNKAMDNRAACAILLNLAENLSQLDPDIPWDIHLVACVQEEFNIRGIMPTVRKLSPDISIGIDVTPSCDTPDLTHYSEVVLNKGPALTCMNFHGRGTLAGVLPDEKLLNSLINTAEQHTIPFQREVALGVITENAFISFENHGVATANLSIPCRYTHTPIETISLSDVQAVSSLLINFIKQLQSDTSFGKKRIYKKERRD